MTEDPYDDGFVMGALWQRLRDRIPVTVTVLPVRLYHRAVHLAGSLGYRTTVTTPAGQPDYRAIRFVHVQTGL